MTAELGAPSPQKQPTMSNSGQLYRKAYMTKKHATSITHEVQAVAWFPRATTSPPAAWKEPYSLERRVATQCSRLIGIQVR